jgi:hypothetical protein
MTPAHVVIGGSDYDRLQTHLHREDRDEHGAIALAGIHHASGVDRLLVRELYLLSDEQFPAGHHGYRQFSPLVPAQLAGAAGDQGLAYLTFHSHPGATGSTRLSRDDLAGHRRVFPHLLDLTRGGPVVGIATGSRSMAGEIWRTDSGPEPLAELRIVGRHLQRLGDRTLSGGIERRFDRQARLFGQDGQRILRAMHVGVVGAGGGGSMLVEQLAHLGVGALSIVDFDRVEQHNLSRIVGATRRDAAGHERKADVAARHARAIDSSVRADAIDGDLAEEWVAERLLSCDFLFLATDTITSRLVFNAITYRYLIPGIQIGAKVELDADHHVNDVYVAVRPVYPDAGCLYCQGLIDPVRLQQEARSDEEVRAQNYLGGATDVVDPSVITLNGIAASHAVNTMLFSATGLLTAGPAQQLFFLRDGSAMTVQPRRARDCPFCSRETPSAYAAGGPATMLPVRPTIR